VKILKGESFRVAITVIRLGNQLGQQAIVGHVAVDALGRRMMAALLPGIILFVHDVAVCASPRITAEV